MKSIDWKTIVIAALIGVVVVLIGSSTERAQARQAADSNSEMIAITGEYGNGTSVLYVIDTKSKQLAVYRSLHGSGVELIGARRIDHDLKLLGYHDRTPASMSATELEKRYSKFREGIPGAGDAPAKADGSEEKK